jgi:hypothetical protein
MSTGNSTKAGKGISYSNASKTGGKVRITLNVGKWIGE